MKNVRHVWIMLIRLVKLLRLFTILFSYNARVMISNDSYILSSFLKSSTSTNMVRFSGYSSIDIHHIHHIHHVHHVRRLYHHIQDIHHIHFGINNYQLRQRHKHPKV